MAGMIEDRRERREVVEQRQDRLELVREAGFSKLSGLSVATGVLAALGAFVLAIGAAAAVVRAVGINTDDLSDSDWRAWGAGAGVFVAAVLLVAFFLGGYAAGRMGRRAGLLHGVLVGAFGVVVLASAVAIGYFEDGTDVIVDRLEGLGAPTAGSDWAGIAVIIGAVALAAMLVGGLLGGVRGEHWHQRLMDRALDPSFGPEAELSRRQRELEQAERRLEREREAAERRGVLVTSRETTAAETTDAPAGDGDATDTITWDPGAEPGAEQEPQPESTRSDSAAPV